MTSLSLPPLQFDDGGFRVSVITGPPAATGLPAVADAKPFSQSEADQEEKPEPEPKPEQEQEQETQRAPPEQPQNAPPQSQQPQSEATPNSNTVLKAEPKAEPEAEPEIEPRPEPQVNPESRPGIESTTPVSQSTPITEPESPPAPEPEPAPVPEPEPAPVPEPQSTPVPEPGSSPAPKHDSAPAPEPRPAPVPESHNVPITVSIPAPAPARKPVPAPEATIDSHQVSELVDVPACLLVGPQQEMPTPILEEAPEPPTVPTHPVASMQLAFAESLDEVTKGGADKPRLKDLDARARRQRLLDQDKDDEPFDARWRYRPGQTQHEVLKLVSQITFGVYLLLNGMANDTSQVITILQGHIDEVDEFLEVTLEDLAQASNDLDDRIDYLKLPMSNVKVFEEMLQDRNYRAEILEGNEKIDQVLGRMKVVMKQWEDDVEAGLQGAAAFNEWLNLVRTGSWRQAQPELVDIFDAMKGNAEGWLNAFDEMESKTQHMNALVAALMTIVAEMEHKVGEVSRKTWSTIPPFTSPAPASLKSKKDTSSISSPLSVHSNPRSTTRTSVRSGSTSTSQHFQSDDEMDDGLGEFPLPGIAPLLPPPRSAARVAKKPTVEPPTLQVNTAPKPSPVVEVIPEEEREDSPLYILQPRTYTPQPPEPLPSPRVRDSPTSPSSLRPQRRSDQAPIPVDARSIDERVSSPASQRRSDQAPIPIDARSISQRESSPRSQRRSDQAPMPIDARSISQRESSPRSQRRSDQAPMPMDARSISQRASSPREDTRLPTGETRDRPGGRASPAVTTSSRISEPRRSNHSNLKLAVRDSGGGHLQVRDSASSHLQARDSAGSNLQTRDSAGSSFQMRDSSGSEMDGLQQHRMPRVGSHAELRATRPSLIQSPNSDYQHYHPVLASPHSPLQQRPHTAAGPQAYHTSGQFPNQVHNQPSRLGGATPNTIASSANDNRTVRPNAPSISSRKTLKKKKSAFGWFKKAFTMDDEERAAFEARKNIQQPDNYYQDMTPKFLDGKRIR